MTMREFTFENQALGAFLVYRLAPGEELDRTALGMLTHNSIPGMLPVSCLSVDAEQMVRFKVSSLTGLMGYWGGPIGRKKLLAFLTSFCRAVLECQEYMLDPGKLLLSWDHVFVDPLSGEVRLAYLPVLDGGEDAGPAAFLRELMQRTIFDSSEDGGHVAVILNAVNSPTFSVEQFQAQLQTLTAPPTKREAPPRPIEVAEPLPVQTPPIPPEQAPQPQVPPHLTAPQASPAQVPPAPKKGGFSLLGSKSGKAPKPEKPQKSDPPPGLGFAVPGAAPAPASEPRVLSAPSFATPPPKEKKGLLGFGKKKERAELIAPAPPVPPALPSPRPPQPAPAAPASPLGGGRTTPLGGAQGAGRTVPLGQSPTPDASAQPAAGGALCLVRRLTGQRASIDKPVFHVGREGRIVDFCISGGHNWLGTDHAYFLTEPDGCYLVDNNSLNHTWLNGAQLVSNQRYPVKAGDVIKMADEEFDLLPG